MSDSEGYIEQFNLYLRDLRVWFVAYGIGGPVLFLTQPGVSKAVASSGGGRLIIALFIGGVVSQVLSSLFGKWASWVQYRHAKYEEFSRLIGLARFWAGNLVIDFLLDMITVVTLGLATWKVAVLFV